MKKCPTIITKEPHYARVGESTVKIITTDEGEYTLDALVKVLNDHGVNIKRSCLADRARRAWDNTEVLKERCPSGTVKRNPKRRDRQELAGRKPRSIESIKIGSWEAAQR